MIFPQNLPRLPATVASSFSMHTLPIRNGVQAEAFFRVPDREIRALIGSGLADRKADACPAPCIDVLSAIVFA